MKKDHPLRVPIPSTDLVKFYRQDPHKSIPDSPRRYVIALGRHTNNFFPPHLPLSVFCYSSIQVVSLVLVHPILVDTIYHAFGAKEADVWEVSLLLLKGGVAGFNTWAWRRLGRGHQGFLRG